MKAGEDRILVLAPWGRDASVIGRALSTAGFDTCEIPAPTAFADAFDAGAGMAFVTEEALTPAFFALLTPRLAGQPTWSDFPFVVLSARHAGARSGTTHAALERLGNVVLLERPLHTESLLSAARSALRGRLRQYEIRRHLLDEQRAALEAARLTHAERSAREATREATDALAFALTAAELGTFHCPLPLGALEWNPTCRSHFWLDPDGNDSVDIDRFFEMVHADDVDRVREGVANAIAHRQPYDIEYRTVSPDGACRWLRAKGMAYGPPGAAAERFDGITIDISAQKALEDQRERLLTAERASRRTAEHASRMKDEFLATLSHELRTPLAAIIGWTHVLRRGVPTDGMRAVDTIERNARTQSRLIDDLLDMSRIISGHVPLDVELIDLTVLADNALASLEPTAAAKRLAVSVSRKGPRPMVRGDSGRLQQVIWNLLANACKFTPDGGRISLAIHHDGERVRLIVEDDGQGIPTSFLPFVFDRFRQSDASATRSHGGLGLGLAIVKHLVDLHGGEVTAHSDGPGLGARFEITFPAADDSLFDDEPPPAAPVEATPCARAGHDLTGYRLLVVDDEPDLCELLRHELEACGASVDAVRTGNEAVALAEERRPHLLISDIGMPDEDGHALLRRIRALGSERGGDVPAIALTAFAGPEDRARALASGFLAHIAKPVDMADLIGQVAAALGIPPASAK